MRQPSLLLQAWSLGSWMEQSWEHSSTMQACLKSAVNSNTKMGGHAPGLWPAASTGLWTTNSQCIHQPPTCRTCQSTSQIIRQDWQHALADGPIFCFRCECWARSYRADPSAEISTAIGGEFGGAAGCDPGSTSPQPLVFTEPQTHCSCCMHTILSPSASQYTSGGHVHGLIRSRQNL